RRRQAKDGELRIRVVRLVAGRQLVRLLRRLQCRQVAQGRRQLVQRLLVCFGVERGGAAGRQQLRFGGLALNGLAQRGTFGGGDEQVQCASWPRLLHDQQ